MQTNPIPASPALAERRYGTSPDEVRERKIKYIETDIFSSELNCFKNYNTKIQKKINPYKKIDYFFYSVSLL
jgi:hypothetical protein